MSELQQAVERLRRITIGELVEDVYKANPSEYRRDQGVIVKAYLAEHTSKPLDAYYSFTSELYGSVLGNGERFDDVSLAREMHKRGVVIPNE